MPAPSRHQVHLLLGRLASKPNCSSPFPGPLPPGASERVTNSQRGKQELTSYKIIWQTHTKPTRWLSMFLGRPTSPRGHCLHGSVSRGSSTTAPAVLISDVADGFAWGVRCNLDLCGIEAVGCCQEPLCPQRRRSTLCRFTLFLCVCSFAGLLLSAAARNKHYKLSVGSVGPLILQDIHLKIAQVSIASCVPCCSCVNWVAWVYLVQYFLLI